MANRKNQCIDPWTSAYDASEALRLLRWHNTRSGYTMAWQNRFFQFEISPRPSYPLSENLLYSTVEGRLWAGGDRARHCRTRCGIGCPLVRREAMGRPSRVDRDAEVSESSSTGTASTEFCRLRS